MLGGQRAGPRERPTVTERAPLAIIAGVRVLSFTQFLLGPAGVQFLADLGADVIKIEPPGGKLWERNWSGSDLYLNGVSAFFLSAHRNQRSLTLDLKHPKGQAIARRLIEGADVLVQNFRPGVMERLGLDYDKATAINPRLIYVSASGYGQSLASISGRAGQPPTPVGTAVVDQHGAALLALGVLAGLLERGRTGRGLHIEVSMLRAALDLQLEIVTYALNGARMEKSPTSLASMFHPGPYGVYETRDGYIVLSMSPLPALQRALDLPELAPYAAVPYNFAAREKIARVLEPVIRKRTTAEWLELLEPQGVWAAPVWSHAEAFADPGFQVADAVEEITHPVAGPVRLLRFPLEFSTGRAAVRRPPPMAGEHVDEILGEIGYAGDEIRRLRDQGVV
ncbi:MAG: CoA transferase [Candidatus Rokuibacteriota bacterium]|nr:MAG: CoA transferase [Candidatus Rokubacteria bacterium]